MRKDDFPAAAAAAAATPSDILLQNIIRVLAFARYDESKWTSVQLGFSSSSFSSS